jgi:hypothetical protein
MEEIDRFNGRNWAVGGIEQNGILEVLPKYLGTADEEEPLEGLERVVYLTGDAEEEMDCVQDG